MIKVKLRLIEKYIVNICQMVQQNGEGAVANGTANSDGNDINVGVIIVWLWEWMLVLGLWDVGKY